MESTYRPYQQRINRLPIHHNKEFINEPIELDNKAINLDFGDEKSLDMLNFSSLINRANLMANGVNLNKKPTIPSIDELKAKGFEIHGGVAGFINNEGNIKLYTGQAKAKNGNILYYENGLCKKIIKKGENGFEKRIIYDEDANPLYTTTLNLEEENFKNYLDDNIKKNKDNLNKYTCADKSYTSNPYAA